MWNRLAIALGIAGLLMSAAPMRAHHAFAAEFDAQKPVKLDIGAMNRKNKRTADA